MKSVTQSLFAFAVLAGVAVSGASAFAAEVKGAAPSDPALVEKIRQSNAACYGCHTEQGLKAPPRADLDLEKLRQLVHDPAQFDASNHAGMECTVCHGQGYKAFPHAAGAKQSISECGECHATKALRIETQFEASVHAKNFKEQFTCRTCHDPHAFRVAAKLGDPHKIVAQDNAMCVGCHNSDLRFALFSASVTPQKVRPDLDTLHAWLPNTRLHWQAVRCIECHTPTSPVKSLGMSHEILGKDKAEKNCVTCHSQETALATRLYRFAAENGTADLGFANAAILDSAYVVGATRNPIVDRTVGVLFGLTVAVLLGHGALRIALALIRRRRSS
ncbi:hypothetical protein EYW49_19525 [Siculibacillus lacustris]|uniref:Doubled CXXCH motif domain-containing protein n=1 Tax=Siculibacillus lacustris TaxID=1549641 RepID=A0A4Q9VFS1_9HYPH|nr:cytochrome c3 family protein [Siculibacillus lacustris]TBW33791.1 hypothetical protein EYW49_19525 [Siculibacillus lacustris]